MLTVALWWLLWGGKLERLSWSRWETMGLEWGGGRPWRGEK